MKKYSLEKLQPVHVDGIFLGSKNEEMDFCFTDRKLDAVNEFRRVSRLPLDDTGYLKQGVITYCVCENI